MSDTVLVERDGPVATLVLNRPEKLNALTKGMWQVLGREVEALSADDALRCILVRGAGDRAFAPGNDIAEFAEERSDVAQARAYGAVMQRTLEAFWNCRHPVVAMIQGVCVGGGLEIAALCDLRICGRSSRFGIPVGRLGLVMSYAELRGLHHLVGRAATLEILLEGRVFGAEEALAKGLVTRVVPDREVVREARASARRIAAGAPLVARWHKRFVNRLADPAPLSAAEIDDGFACFGTDDFRRGYQAFLNKRTPRFEGR